MAIFVSAFKYVQTGQNLVDKIIKIDAIISALEDAALLAAEGQNITQYSLNDGQTTISTTYRNLADIERSILGFERTKQRYINQANGRMTRLVDSKNFLN